MKKTATSILLFTLFILSASGQLAIKWQKTYGGSGNDQVGDDSNYYDASDQAIVQTDDGGYVMIGFTASTDGPFSTNNGNNDFAAIRVDSLGNMIWSNTYGGTQTDMATSIVKTNDGGFAIVGYTSALSDDVLLIKIDGAGTLQWQSTYGGSSMDRAYSLSLAPDGGFYIGAISSSNDSDHVSIGNGSLDFWLIKTDSSGVLQWEKSYGSSSYDWLNSMKVCPDGGIVMCGFVYAGDSDVTVSNGAIDVWVLKVDSLGNILWEKSYGGSGNDWGFSITLSSDGGYAFAALTESNDSMVTGYHGGHDYWIVKLDSLGNVIWQKDLGGSQLDECYDILETPDQGYLIAGTTNCIDGDLTQNYGFLDFNVMKVNSAGGFEWSRTYGGSGNDWGMSIISDGNGEYVLAGSSISSDFDMTNNAGGWDFALLKLTDAYNTITGTIYYDNNNNQIYDSADAPVINQMVQDSIGGLVGFTNANGVYYIETVDTGTFNISAGNLNYYTIQPASHIVNLSAFNLIDSLNDFSAVPIPGVYDVEVNIIPLNRFRPGFDLEYLVTLSNIGTEPFSSSLMIVLDSGLTFNFASIPPDSINGDTLIWNSIALNVQQSIQIIINTTVDPSISINSSITTNASLTPETGIIDQSLDNNVSSWVGLVTGAFDPNDKAVSSDILFTTQFPDVPYLEYLIRFQNTGNDTAFNVVLRDTLSSMLDISTFQVVNSSHLANVSYEQLSRIVTVSFANILLPDSNTNKPLSNGYFQFKVKPVSTLVNGDIIENTAGIYFDFNQAIITNTATTQVQFPTSIKTLNDLNFGIYPNPTSGNIVLSLKEQNKAKNCYVKIINAMGQDVFTKDVIPNKDKIDLNVSNLVPGIYIVRLIFDNQVSSRHFIKE